MINYLLIIVGLVLVIVGFYHLSRFLLDFEQKLTRMEIILSSQRFQKIEKIENELDELNYSYYEILNELVEKVDELSGDKNQEEKINEQNTDILEQKQKIKQMIAKGHSDAEIAKQLNIGSGEVAIIRSLTSKKEEIV